MKSKILFLATAGLALASCSVKDTIYDTSHPNHGTITLTTDWSGIGAGITKPASYTIEVAGKTVTANKDSYTIDNLFEPGTYIGSAYNQVAVATDKISISGIVATVTATTTPSGASGTFIEPLPGWLFTAHNPSVVIEKDKHHEFTAVMQQQVRQLTLVLKPEGGTMDKISGITAELSGAAQSWDFAANQPTGSAAKVAPVFTKISSGTDAGSYTATVRLLGVTGTKQELTATFSFTGGNPQNLTITSDLTTALANFNALADAKTPLTLGATVVETPTQSGFTCTINGWVKVAGSGSAN